MCRKHATPPLKNVITAPLPHIGVDAGRRPPPSKNKHIGVDAGRRPATCETPCSHAWGDHRPHNKHVGVNAGRRPARCETPCSNAWENLPHKQAHLSNRGSETRSMRNPMQQCMGKATALKNKRIGVPRVGDPQHVKPHAAMHGESHRPHKQARRRRAGKNQRGSNRTIAGRIRGATES